MAWQLVLRLCWEHWKQAALLHWLQPTQAGAEQPDAAVELASALAAAALVGSPLTAASDVAAPVIISSNELAFQAPCQLAYTG